MMESTRNLIVLVFVLFFIVIMPSCGSKIKEQKSAQEKGLVVQVETFRSGEGWGYEIIIAGKTKIKQSMIPAIQGNIPFNSEKEARQVGNYIIQKMKKGETPVISIRELDSLQIKY